MSESDDGLPPIGTIFDDEFRVGDMVTWRDDVGAEFSEARKDFGDGLFEVIGVREVPDELVTMAGHYQHVMIATDLEDVTFSGAFFKRA